MYSQVKYRYDIGANIEASSPAPGGQTYGKTTKRVYDDDHGRLMKDSVYINTTEKSYTRYEYPDNGIQSKVYSTLVDVDGDGDIAEDEALTETFFDGAGRVLRSRSPHPGSTGGWTATKAEYDILGRVTGQTVPAEVSVSGTTWTPAGDDSAGFKWTHQEYDWKDRVIRKVNTDGNPAASENDSDVFISYAGCGCAGGVETTILGELVPRTDTAGSARRKQKIYQDILGRTAKTETFEWNGSTVYSSVVNTFDGRDQIVRSRQYAGTISSGTYQDTTAAFDGHGRLVSSHKPQQRDASDNLKYTTYSYYPDGSIQSVTDGRGAVKNYSYNSRGLVTGISYSVPGGSGIADPADVSFSYDNIGNRITMTDGLGTVAYSYDPLSRMTSELREFNDSLPEAPENDNGYKIQYTYHIGGQLKSLTEPFGMTINYDRNMNGQLLAVAPSTSVNGVSTFASGFQYRAFGGLKHMTFSNGVVVSQTFTNRLQPSNFQIGTSSQALMNKSYEYYSDGRLKRIDDALDAKYDRLSSYDHQGNVLEAKSGVEANGQTATDFTQLPYRQSYEFDAFGNLTERNNRFWGATFNSNYQFVNDRITSQYEFQRWGYDNDGRVTAAKFPDPITENSYDAAGRLLTRKIITESEVNEDETTRYYDGDGRELKRDKTLCVQSDPEESCAWSSEPTVYYLRSTVLGGEVMSEANGCAGCSYSGGKSTVYLVAEGSKFGSIGYEKVIYDHSDPSGMTHRSSYSTTPVYGYLPQWMPGSAEMDPGGTNVGLLTPFEPPGPGEDGDPPIGHLEEESPFYINGQRATVTMDGFSLNFQEAMHVLNSGWIGGSMGMTQILMKQFDARLTNVRVRPWDSNTQFNYGNDIQAAIAHAGSLNFFASIYANVNFGTAAVLMNTQVSGQSSNSRKARKTDYAHLADAVDQCARRLFGVSMIGGRWSAAGIDGIMHFTVLHGGVVSQFDRFGRESYTNAFSVTNLTGQFSAAEMGGSAGFTPRQGTAVGLYSIPGSMPNISGTQPNIYETNTTFTARDRDAPGMMSYGQEREGAGLGLSGFEHTQIHETGVALSIITGIPRLPDPWRNPATGSLEPYSGDEDAGQAFENCVLRGYRSRIARQQRR